MKTARRPSPWKTIMNRIRRSIALLSIFIFSASSSTGQEVVPDPTVERPYNACSAMDDASLFKSLAEIRTTISGHHDGERLPPDCSKDFFSIAGRRRWVTVRDTCPTSTGSRLTSSTCRHTLTMSLSNATDSIGTNDSNRLCRGRGLSCSYLCSPTRWASTGPTHVSRRLDIGHRGTASLASSNVCRLRETLRSCRLLRPLAWRSCCLSVAGLTPKTKPSLHYQSMIVLQLPRDESCSLQESSTVLGPLLCGRKLAVFRVVSPIVFNPSTYALLRQAHSLDCLNIAHNLGNKRRYKISCPNLRSPLGYVRRRTPFHATPNSLTWVLRSFSIHPQTQIRIGANMKKLICMVVVGLSCVALGCAPAENGSPAAPSDNTSQIVVPSASLNLIENA